MTSTVMMALPGFTVRLVTNGTLLAAVTVIVAEPLAASEPDEGGDGGSPKRDRERSTSAQMKPPPAQESPRRSNQYRTCAKYLPPGAYERVRRCHIDRVQT